MSGIRRVFTRKLIAMNVFVLVIIGILVTVFILRAESNIKPKFKNLSNFGYYVEQQFISFLVPIKRLTLFSSDLVANNVITPKNSKEFGRYLLGITKLSKYYQGAYWATPDGNFYIVERDYGNEGRFVHKEIIRSSKPNYTSTIVLDSDGRVINKSKKFIVNFHTEKRPWYIKTISRKTQTWTGPYLYHAFQQEGSILGSTLSEPIYDESGNLKGIFSIDISLNQLDAFLGGLQYTKSAITYIANQDGELIASDGLIRREENVLPKISILEPEWIRKSFKTCTKELNDSKGVSVAYSFNKNQYVALCRMLHDVIGEPLHLITVLPEKDITERIKGIINYSLATSNNPIRDSSSSGTSDFLNEISRM